jgi:hypothetical protein
MVMCLLPQANGHARVDFVCTHPIDGLLWNLPIYLLGFFSKYECWVTNLIMTPYHFIFLGCHLFFLYQEVSYHYEIYIFFRMTNLKNEICLINIQIIRLSSFKSY